LSTEAADVMVADLEVMARANNYRNWIYRQIAPYIGERILEVGSGIGNFTELLLERELVVATDKYDRCVHYLQSRLGHQLKLPPTQLDIANPNGEFFETSEFDTVICLNVLEHVKDDGRALSFMYSVLAPGGRLILLVPAFQFLYGSVDRSIEHYRRYNKKSLLPIMRESGFQVERAFYMNVVGMFGWFWNNRVIRTEMENPGQIGFFDNYLAPWAERLEKLIPPPFGLSLIAVGLKS